MEKEKLFCKGGGKTWGFILIQEIEVLQKIRIAKFMLIKRSS